MANEEVTGDIVKENVHVIVVLWILVTLLVLGFLLVVFWDRICAGIALNALEQGMREIAAPR